MYFKTRAKKHIIYPYLFGMVVLFLILILTPSVWLTFGSIKGLFNGEILKDELSLFLTLWSLIIIVFIVIIINGFYYLGSYKLTKDAIVLYAPLRRRIKIAFDDIKYIGLDYGLIQNKPEFWIYISKTPIQQKYWNKITKLPFSRSTVRILYTPDRFSEFLSFLPLDLSKDLQKGVSMLRKFKVNTITDK